MTKGNVIEHPEVVNLKESRTQALLRQFNIGTDFLDPALPKGLFSFSQYNSWLICARAYEFKYVQQVRTPDYVATSRGSAVHAGVEHMLRMKMAGKPLLVEEGREVVSKSFDEKAKGIIDWGEEKPGEVKDGTLALFNTYVQQGLAKVNPVAVEEGFIKKIGTVPMAGWIDLIDEQPAMNIAGMAVEHTALLGKRRVTVDLKTGKAKWSGKEVALEPQLTLYAYVAGTPFVRIDLLQSHKTKKGPPTSFSQVEGIRGHRDVEIFIEHLEEVVDYVKKGIFPRTEIDHWSCDPGHCSFHHLCRGKKSP